MKPLTFEMYQSYLKLKYQHCIKSTDLFMKLVEEVGETAEALNMLEGRKHDDGLSSLESELVDIIHYTLAIASVHNIDLSHAIIEKDKVAFIKYNQEPNLESFLENTSL